jgi:hypothetical protein
MIKFLLLFMMVLFGLSCGKESGDGGYSNPPAPQPQPQPSPNPNPQPNPTDPTQEFNTTVKPLLQKNCGGGNCHTSGGSRDAAIQSANNFIKGTSGQRIQSGNMPPSGTAQANNFSAADKSTLLGFIAKYK